ncbi:MAG: sigma-70 family RNA polymerase sigma factor [Gemmatimonadaceae bacterium]|nr:sigma-70 family RNA polymerase sigma factor [Gemmatimonadaceae bacterium]
MRTEAVVGTTTSAADAVVRLDAHEQFDVLLQRHGVALRRLCAMYESNATDRDDLMQEIAFAIWRALPGFRGECSERTFVYRIAHNRALSHRYRRPLASAPLSEADQVADPAANSAASVERASERERLLRAVRHLPATLRETVVLRLEGLNDREISDVLGISEGNVAVRLTRARQSLRAALVTPTPSCEP